MGNGHGGARPNSGRKKSAIKDKLENDIYGKKIQVLKFEDDLVGEEMPAPGEYLSEQTKGVSENIGREVYEKTWIWLKERGCEKLINPIVLEQYAMCVARWIQAEMAVHRFGFIAKHPTTEMPTASPFIRISQDFLKQSTTQWLQIYQIVKENCSEAFTKDEVDPMAMLLNSSEGIAGNN